MDDKVVDIDKARADAQLKKTMLHLLKKYDVPDPKIHPKLIEAMRCFKDLK